MFMKKFVLCALREQIARKDTRSIFLNHIIVVGKLLGWQENHLSWACIAQQLFLNLAMSLGLDDCHVLLQDRLREVEQDVVSH